MRAIYQIVPCLPPLIDGVGDYALQLASHLRESYCIESRFIVGNSSWPGPTEVEGFPVQICDRSASSVLNALSCGDSPDAVLLHYVNYGYHFRGIPFWLIDGLKLWQGSSSSHCLFIVFHEVWAKGPPWSSTFFLRIPQRWIAQQLLRSSQVSVTSTIRMKQLLEQGTSRLVHVFPVPSNIPFPVKSERCQKTSQPPFRILIFGQLGSRISAIKAHKQLLAELARRNMVGQVVVVGQGSQVGEMNSADVHALLDVVPAAKVKVLGETEPSEIANQLAQADFYLSFYDAYLACKSGSFMAALACGCPPVLRRGLNSEPLEPEKHFLVCDGSTEGISDFIQNVENEALKAVGEAGQKWYQENADWELTAHKWQEILTKSIY